MRDIKHIKMEDVKIGKKLTIWYIGDGRAKFCSGIVESDGSYYGFISIIDFDNDITTINKDTIYDITE